jgi:hypothetical protein
MSTIHKTIIGPYLKYEIVTYSPWLEELPSGCTTIVESPLHFFIYLFWRNVGKDVVKKALGNNRLPSAILGKDSTHTYVCQVYK